MQPEVPSSDQAGYMPQEPPTFTIRPATIADAALITRVISALAKFDNALHEVRTTEADILRDGFGADPHIYYWQTCSPTCKKICLIEAPNCSPLGSDPPSD
jgi:hypothetical protein